MIFVPFEIYQVYIVALCGFFSLLGFSGAIVELSRDLATAFRRTAYAEILAMLWVVFVYHF